MPNITDQQIVDLHLQVKKTIKALTTKYQSSREQILEGYIDRYKDILNCIDSGSSKEDISKVAKKVKGCARGYLEFSSNYKQNFLDEMGRTEKLIKLL